MVTQLKSYQFRIYPTAVQRQQLSVEFGHNRFVWNRCLELRTKEYEENKTKHNYVSLGKKLTEWKRNEFPWLSDCSSVTLTQTLIDQDKAFQNFFRRVKLGQKPGYPKFKSRYSKQSIRFTLNQRNLHNIYSAGDFVSLPKLGSVKIRWSRIPVGIPKMATVSKSADGKYFISFSCEEEIQHLPKTGQTVGIDLGIKDVFVTWNGTESTSSGNPRHLKRKLKHLKTQQRRLSRMQKGSNRRQKQRLKVARIYSHVANCRKDFLHKATTGLIRSADVIAIEDLHIKGMLKNHCLAGAISDVGMSEFRRQLNYKAEWYGRKIVLVDRWFPSSKTCSNCGSYQKVMPLNIRHWICPDCGTFHDRDVNAAKNIYRFTTAGEAGIARGGSKNLLDHVSSTPVETRTERKISKSVKWDGKLR